MDFADAAPFSAIARSRSFTLFSSVVVCRKILHEHSFGSSGFPEAIGTKFRKYHPVFTISTICLPPSSLKTTVAQPDVHLDEQLVKGLLALVVTAAKTRTALAADSVDLIDEDNAGRALACRIEQVTHA